MPTRKTPSNIYTHTHTQGEARALPNRALLTQPEELCPWQHCGSRSSTCRRRRLRPSCRRRGCESSHQAQRPTWQCHRLRVSLTSTRSALSQQRQPALTRVVPAECHHDFAKYSSQTCRADRVRTERTRWWRAASRWRPRRGTASCGRAAMRWMRRWRWRRVST